MLDLVQFTDGRYGLQNNITGIVLPKTFRTKWGALRHARKIQRRFSKTIRNINKRSNKYTNR